MGTKIELDCSVYTQDSVKETVYRFSDEFSTIIRKKDDCLILDITFNSPETKWQEIKQEFEKELLDQSLRERIRKETADIKRVILAHTFSKTSIVEH